MACLWFKGLVDIGYAVLVEQSILTQLSVTCHGGPGKYARALLRHLFDDSELEGRSSFGGKSRGSSGQKEALDPVRVKAIIVTATFSILGYFMNAM
ncbi:hypothetical protein HPB52_021424 [Rhipicephalus sanguineus]|uniref:BEN domain-containing protein n=1 Tax=Rhipicephalus sanguineus TaxID=34632 RepID=A0A9D4PET5_RHISA|nr:hypothetical protein HPB52_021424 [Rhipicephalus sanguineus]